MGTKSLLNPLRNNRCYVSLACSIGSMSLACGSLLQIPNTADRISLQRGFFLTSLGFIYFISLTDFCNKYFLETQRGIKFRKKYHLMVSDVMEVTNKIVSAVQAFFSFLVGFIVCKSTCTKSFVYASHFLMEAYGWFGTAYFMYDIWSMYKVHTQKLADKLKTMRLNVAKTNGQSIFNKTLPNKFGSNEQSSNGINGNHKVQNTVREKYDYDNDDAVHATKNGKLDFLKYMLSQPVMMIHHIFIGTFGFLVVTYIRGGGHCIYSYMFMMEFSTPFVSMRGMLSTMGLKDTRIYIINGLTMLGTFFICRVLMWPYVMWRYSVVIDTTIWQALTGLPRGCIIGILILFLPQIYWFYLMLRGALKVFFPSRQLERNKTKSLQQQEEQQQQQQQSVSKNNNLSPMLNSTEAFSQFEKLSVNGNLKTSTPADIITAAASCRTTTTIVNSNN